METPKIFVAVPTDGLIHHKVVGVLCNILINSKYSVETYISSMRGIGEHRNVIVKAFLETDCDYLLFIDSDNPPPNNVLRLIENDVDIVGCPTPINMNWDGVNDFGWNVWEKKGVQAPIKGSGLEEVYSAGTGCMLIKREVLEKIKHPFTTVRDADDMRTTGTDMAFCGRARKAGYKIHVHWDYTCDHYKEINLKTLI